MTKTKFITLFRAHVVMDKDIVIKESMVRSDSEDRITILQGDGWCHTKAEALKLAAKEARTLVEKFTLHAHYLSRAYQDCEE